MKQINLDKHFLKKDQMIASLEIKCIGDCLEQVIEEFKRNEFGRAKERTIDMLASLQAITNLAEDKQAHDRYNKMLEGIPTFTEFRISRMARP